MVDTSQRETVPEAGQLLSKVLSDHRIRGKPVLLLANKIDLDGVTEAELDQMLNLQHLVNSVRCLTRLDISCATDLKNDKGIFEGFKWLISHIESNFHDINTRVLSDTLEEKNREKARREAVRVAREAEKLAEESLQVPGSPLAASTPVDPSAESEQRETLSSPGPDTENPAKSPENPAKKSKPSSAASRCSPCTSPRMTTGALLDTLADSTSSPRPISVTRLPPEPVPANKIPLPLLPPINSVVATPFVDQPVKLPRLKSPKSRPEIINRIEETGICVVSSNQQSSIHTYPPVPGSDQYYDEKGFRFRKISAAQRLSPEGADSDPEGIVNMAYEPSEDLSSDSTPIGVRKHNFHGAPLQEGELQNREIFMITTMAEVHKEYYKHRKDSTSTHDSVTMSVASLMSDATDVPVQGTATNQQEDGQSLQGSLLNGHPESEHATAENTPNKGSVVGPLQKPKSKKRLNTLKSRNKTAPLPSTAATAAEQQPGIKFNSPLAALAETNRFVSAKVSTDRTPFTVSSAWSSTEVPERMEMNGLREDTEQTGKF